MPNTVPGVRRMTDMVIREQTPNITSRAITIPFQFLSGGAPAPRSCKERERESGEREREKQFLKGSSGKYRDIQYRTTKHRDKHANSTT